MYLLERLSNILLYLSLITIDFICFAILCAIPIVAVGFLCLLFVRDKEERKGLISMFRVVTFGVIIREIAHKMFRRR